MDEIDAKTAIREVDDPAMPAKPLLIRADRALHPRKPCYGHHGNKDTEIPEKRIEIYRPSQQFDSSDPLIMKKSTNPAAVAKEMAELTI